MSDVPTEAMKQTKPAPAPVKQVRLKLAYVDLWSAVKMSALIALVLSIVIFVSTLVIFAILNQTGILDSLSGIIADVLGDGGGGILALLEFSQVLALSLVAAVINLVSFTVLGSLSALIYNAIARITGGYLVGFTTT
jgi:hypothetical protein